MLNFKHSIFIAVVLITLKHSKGFNKSSQVEDNDILRTNFIIRNTTNKLFTSLKLKGIKEKPIVKHYCIIHSYFVSLTLQDYNNLKQIAKVSRVDKKINSNKTYYNRLYDNRTTTFIEQVIDILNNECYKTESNDSKEIVFPVFNYTDCIVTYLDAHFKEMEYHLQFYRSANTPRLDINKNILAVLNDEAKALYRSEKLEDIFGIQLDHAELNKTANVSEEDDELDNESDTWMDPRLSGRRIFNGIRTKVRHFPFMASIEIFDRFTCGGSIISEDVIVTAASCLQLAWNNRLYRENPKFIKVRIGSNFFSGGGDLIPALELFFYPTYNPKTLNNNIAMIRIIRKIKFTKRKSGRVKKISFDKRESPLPMNVEGITIVGWGGKTIKNIASHPWNNKISYAVLDVYSLQECQDIYSKEYVTRTNFCAGFISKGSGACNKDIGGPGIVGGILTGIISFGSPKCETPNSPTVFTKVGYYADWIEEIIERAYTAPLVQLDTTLQTKAYSPFTLSRSRTTIIFPDDLYEEGISVTIFPPKHYYEPTEHETEKSITENIPILTKSVTHEFKDVLKTMLDSQEIVDYLKLNAVKKESNLMNNKVSKYDKKKYLVTVTDSDVNVTPVESKHKNKHDKKKHGVIPITTLDYNHISKHTPKYDYYDLMQENDAMVYTTLGISSNETTEKDEKSKKTTVTPDLDVNYSYEETKQLKTKTYTTKMQKQTFKVTPITIKMEQNKEVAYANMGYYDYDIEAGLTSSQKKLIQKQISSQEDINYLEPAKHVLPIQILEKLVSINPALVKQAVFNEDLAKQALAEETLVNQAMLEAQENKAAIFNDDNYTEKYYENNMSFDDHEGIQTFEDTEIDTKELKIDLEIDNKVNKAEKQIDDMLKDFIFGPKYNGDEDKNQEIEEMDSYGHIPVGDDMDFDINDVIN